MKIVVSVMTVMTFRVHIALYFVHAFFFIMFPSSLLLSIAGQFHPKFSSSAFRILSLSSSLSSLFPSPTCTHILYLNLEFMYDRLLFSLKQTAPFFSASWPGCYCWTIICIHFKKKERKRKLKLLLSDPK